jgi:hypothetical protein
MCDIANEDKRDWECGAKPAHNRLFAAAQRRFNSCRSYGKCTP